MTTTPEPQTLPTRDTRPDLWQPPERPGHVPQTPNHHHHNGPDLLDPDHDRYVYRPQGGGGSAFVVRNGLYVPLEYINPGDPLQGGYGWLDYTDSGMTFHPGSDLNSGGSCDADLDNQCVATADGYVLAILPWDHVSRGEGNHLWVFYDDPRVIGPVWAHFDHLASFAPGLQEGQRFTAGQLLGRVGKTGGWSCAHLHCETARCQPSSWWQWPYAWPRSQVEAAYYDPAWWYQQSVAKAGQMGGDDVRTDTTPEERAAVQPYFSMLGYECNMETALMKRAALAYYRDESRGPAVSYEYPAVAPDGSQVTRQKFTAGIAEAKLQGDGTWWTGWVEVVTDPGALQS